MGINNHGNNCLQEDSEQFVFNETVFKQKIVSDETFIKD